MLINVSGTLNYKVTAGSESGWDGGRLFLSSSLPEEHSQALIGGYAGEILGMTTVSNPVSGTGSSEGTEAVTADQYLVLMYFKDSSATVPPDSITVTLSITPS